MYLCECSVDNGRHPTEQLSAQALHAAHTTAHSTVQCQTAVRTAPTPPTTLCMMQYRHDVAWHGGTVEVARIWCHLRVSSTHICAWGRS